MTDREAKQEQGLRDALNQRGWDLLRQVRHVLLAEQLITQDEYTYLLVEVQGSVKRLADYDKALAASRAPQAGEQVAQKVYEWYVAQQSYPMPEAVRAKIIEVMNEL